MRAAGFSAVLPPVDSWAEVENPDSAMLRNGRSKNADLDHENARFTVRCGISGPHLAGGLRVTCAKSKTTYLNIDLEGRDPHF